MFLGCLLVKDGGVVWKLCKDDQRLEVAEQGGAWREAGGTGARPGTKKRKASSPGVQGGSECRG
jgi:hypothetical protein